MKTRPKPRAVCTRAAVDFLLLTSGSPALIERVHRRTPRHARVQCTGIDRGAIVLAGQCAELRALHTAAPDLFAVPDVAAALALAATILNGA